MKPTQGSARPNSAFLSIEQASKLLRRRKISAVELLEESLARINKLNPALNVFITVTADLARRQARRVDRQILRREATESLARDSCVAQRQFLDERRSQHGGSKILADFVPDQDSEVAAPGSKKPVQFSWVRQICTSLLTVLLQIIRILDPCAIRGRATETPAG